MTAERIDLGRRLGTNGVTADDEGLVPLLPAGRWPLTCSAARGSL